MSLPKGPRNVHIQNSQGADTNIMKFYVTQNSTTYGARHDKFVPRPGKHRGTGYLSNFRPAVFYNRRLDDVDNPALRRICDGNYRSVTQMDFQPYRDPSGLEKLPGNVHQMPSGFIRQKPLTIPYEKQVNGTFIDTRAASAPAHIMPRHKPLLHHIQSKDPTELENCGYGPKYMKSETQEKFKGQPWPSVDVSTRELGPQEVSGFVHNINDEPVTYEPRLAHGNEKPGWYTHRPTGVSICKTSFVPTEWSRGDDKLPGGVCHGSERGTGFTKDEVKPKYVNLKAPTAYDRLSDMPELKADRTRRQDPVEYLNMQFPHNKTSVTGEQFKGQQRPSATEADRNNRTSVGFKEETGYVENNPRFTQTDDNKMRFLTHYMTGFGTDPTPVGVDRAGHLRGGVQRQKLDGFTKSTGVMAYGSDPSASQILGGVHPYVGRSLQSKNVFFDDHTHDAKTHMQAVI